MSPDSCIRWGWVLYKVKTKKYLVTLPKHISEIEVWKWSRLHRAGLIICHWKPLFCSTTWRHLNSIECISNHFSQYRHQTLTQTMSTLKSKGIKVLHKNKIMERNNDTTSSVYFPKYKRSPLVLSPYLKRVQFVLPHTKILPLLYILYQIQFLQFNLRCAKTPNKRNHIITK